MPKLFSFSGSKFPPFQYIILGKSGILNLSLSRVMGGKGNLIGGLDIKSQAVESLNLIYQLGEEGGGKDQSHLSWTWEYGIRGISCLSEIEIQVKRFH